MLKALIFDFDGLLVDTESTEYRSFHELGMRLGIELPLELWHHWVGTVNGRYQAFDYVCHELGDPAQSRLPELEHSFNEIYSAFISQQDLLPGARELLAQAKSHDLKLAIASSSDYDWVSSYLRKFDILSYFDHIQTRDHVKKVKPDPEIYLRAMHHLRVDAQEAVAFEDSYVGSIAAKSAGLRCIVVPNLVTKALDFSHADQVITSLLDVNLAQMLKSFH